MHSLTEKIKKQKKKIQAFVTLRGHKHWKEDPNVLNRLDSLFDPICTSGLQGIESTFKPDSSIDLSEMPAFEENLTTGRNRWKHLGCVEDTRVKLTLGPVEYIHANYISTPKLSKRIIATQAPLDKTADEFWYMVLQEKSEIIISLCPVDGKNCAKIFARKKGDNRHFAYRPLSQLNIFTSEVSELEYEQNGVTAKICMREIVIIPYNGKEFVCRHYRWVWDQKLTENVTSIPMQFLQDLPKTKTPIVIHCRDGVGLTGCFVMFQYYLDLLKADHCEREILSPAHYLAELRKQRHAIIENVSQFHYIHMVLLKYFADEIGKDHQDLEKFTNEYVTAMEGANLEGSTSFPA